MAHSHYLSLKDVAAQLGVEYKTVYRLVRRGELPATRVGWLYRLRQEEVDAYLQSRHTKPQPQEQPDLTAVEYLRCEACRRLIKDEEGIGGPCQHAGCEALLCTSCWTDERRFCPAHTPSPALKLAAARQAKAAGEVSVLVTAIEARRRELNFHNRFTRKTRNLAAVLHPLSGNWVPVKEWPTYHTSQNEQERIELLLAQQGQISPNVSAGEPITHLPVNLRTSYRLPGDRQQPALEIAAQTVSHLLAFTRDSFDTNPLNEQDLFTLLLTEAAAAEEANRVVVLGLAATTGWQLEARLLLLGQTRGEAWTHPLLYPCLIDLETREVIYNPAHEALSFYADLFALPLPEEEVMAVERYVQATLQQLSSLADSEVRTALGVSPGAVLTAFQRLVASGRYFIEDVDGIGRVIAPL